MKRFYLPRFRIMLLTLTLGLASVSFFNWLPEYLNEVLVDLPKVESGSPIFVFPRYNREIRKGGGSGSGHSYSNDFSNEEIKHNKKAKKKAKK